MAFDGDGFLCALGLAMLLESLPFLLMPARMREALIQLLNEREGLLRQMGCLGLGTGVFLIWLARG